MKTFLFAWNPRKWNWKSLESSIAELAEIGKTREKWSCYGYRSVQPGDRAFLIRLGVEPKGIVGSGMITSIPFLAPHWSGAPKLIYQVEIEFDVLLNADFEPILTEDIVKQGRLASQRWMPQTSGIAIRPELTDELEAVWFDFLTTQDIRHKPFESTDIAESVAFQEGVASQVLQTRYERNPHARNVCLSHYGYNCVVCGFNFENYYGEIGKDFIHVHHLSRSSESDVAQGVDPILDLRPICLNCHAMLHRRKEGYTIEYLKSRINSL